MMLSKISSDFELLKRTRRARLPNGMNFDVALLKVPEEIKDSTKKP